MNPNLAGISPSLIRAIAAKKRPTSIDLGIGEPLLRPDQRYFTAASQWVAERGCPYSLNAGDYELRERIAAHYAYPGLTSAEHVCITTGSQEALYVAIAALLDPATDALAVIEPAFGSYAKIAQLNGVRVVSIALNPADGFAFDIDRIVERLTPDVRMLALCSPSNPTGRVLRGEDAKALAHALQARSGPPIIVLFDEVYRELNYTDESVSFAEFYEPTVVINSLSKSNALTGLRIGWAIAPLDLMSSIVKMHAWLSSAASTFGQRVGVEIFRDSMGLRAHAQLYQEQAARVTQLLNEQSLTFAPVEGAFYAMLRLPGVEDSVAAALQIAEEDDVIVVPGRAFGAVSEGWLRISWVAPIEQIAQALTRMTSRFA